MRKVQSSAATRQSAIQKALDELGCELHEVDIEIVDEGSKGFLGIGARDVEVIVRAEHLPDDGSYAEIDEDNIGNLASGVDYGAQTRTAIERREASKNRNRNRGRGGRDDNRGGRTRTTSSSNDDNRGNREPNTPAPSRPERPARAAKSGDKEDRPSSRGRGRNRNRKSEAGAGSEGTERTERTEPREGRNRNRKRNEKRTDNAKGAEGSERTERPARVRKPRKEQAPRPKRRERETPVDAVAAEAAGKDAANLLQEIITKMGMESTVTSKLNEEMDIVLDVAAEDSAILIGRKGRNLDAMQFLINRVMLKGDETDVVDRIVVDVEGYIQRRRESLEEMALSMAARAKETGKSLRIKPLDAHERRIVHLVLEKDDEIRTFSLGGSALRRVVIVPNNEGTVEAKDEDTDDAPEVDESYVEETSDADEVSVAADSDASEGDAEDSEDDK